MAAPVDLTASDEVVSLLSPSPAHATADMEILIQDSPVNVQDTSRSQMAESSYLHE